jgi:hypothetical protein
MKNEGRVQQAWMSFTPSQGKTEKQTDFYYF